MKANFDRLYAFRGRKSQAFYALDENGEILSDVSVTLVGNRSAGTRFDGNHLVTDGEETADEMTAVLTCGEEVLAVPVTVLDASGRDAAFDEENVRAVFGVITDTHVSGSWKQPVSVSKWVHAVDVMQRAAGTGADGKTKLDALLGSGDYVDAINYAGYVKDVGRYGPKAAQNYRETAYIRSGLEGRNTNRAKTAAAGAPEVTEGFGAGLSVPFFYCLGNHDEFGMGVSMPEKGCERVYTAEYFVAVLCGWEYDPSRSGTPDGYDDGYRAYAADLIALYRAGGADADVKVFGEKHKVDGAHALGRFRAYYGMDTDLTADVCGLTVGNRHAVIGGIHLIAVERSQSLLSAAFLKRWCAESVKEDPSKPILVLTHEKLAGTYDWTAHDTSAGNHGTLLGVLGRYPQCIVFTGHMHSPLNWEDAILSESGFTSVDGAGVGYLCCEYIVGASYPAPGNFMQKNDYGYSAGCLVRIDKNNTVEIRRVDLSRSYKEPGHENGPVFIGEPWVISGISGTGSHLLTYNRERGEAPFRRAPAFSADARAVISAEGDRLTVSFPAAVCGGAVRYYLVELIDPDDPDDRPYQYVSGMFFRCANAAELAAAYPEYTAVFPLVKPQSSPSLDRAEEAAKLRAGAVWHVKVTPYDTWHTAGEPITD